MNRSLWFALPAAVFVTIFVMKSRVPDASVQRQQQNMAIAQQHLPRVEALLGADSRFREVQAYVYTGQDGAIGFTGWVENDETLFALMKAVAAENLPVAICWQVKVSR